MHARFLFFVVSIVSRVVRAQSGKSAGRIFYVHGRPPSPGKPARTAVDRARARTADVGRYARVVRCDAMPGRARARRGSCDASRACVVRCCAAVHARAPAGPYGLLCRLWPYHGRGKSTGMPAPTVRPRPHSVAYRLRARAPVGQTGRRRDTCTRSTSSLENRQSIAAGRPADWPSVARARRVP